MSARLPLPCRLRLGTRGSALALRQAERVACELAARHPGITVEPVVIRTEGDVDKTSPLTEIGGRGVFTSALQEALARGEIDVAVHSAKDLPSGRPPGLALVAFLAREDPRDAFVSRHGLPLAELPPNPTIGTSSRRRAVQIAALRPDARIVNLRGNVDTRLRKAQDPELDGIVLAVAGVQRMGWADRITEYLSLDHVVPSPGQGALAVEARADDAAIVALLHQLDDPAVSRAVRVERAFLRAIGGGCTTPVGAYAEAAGEGLRFRAVLASEEGDRVERADVSLPPAARDAEVAAAALAARMLAAVRAPVPARVAAAGNGAARLPLAGLTVLVTRAQDQARDLVAALREQGAEPIELPTIRIEDTPDPAPLDAALGRLRQGEYDWTVFTSANAVRRVFARLAALGLDAGALSRARVAAVGNATAAKLLAEGVEVDLVPARFVAEEVLAEMTRRGVAGQRVLCPRGNLGRDVLTEGLRAAGALVDEVEAYRTLPQTEIPPAARERIAGGEVDIVTFASPSSVRGLATILDSDLAPLANATVACIGPITADAARAAGLEPTVVAADSTVPGLVAAMVAHQAKLAKGSPSR